MESSTYDKMFRIDREWGNCRRCVLHESRNVVVGWRGSLTAKIFVIGEAPGRHEDEKGIPFVGKAGKKLDELIAAAGLRTHLDVFITNTVGCRPPGNRTPSKDEIKACKPRLELMIGISKPNVLLLLGATAAFHIAGIKQVSKWQGKSVLVETWQDGKIAIIPAVPTYHPSYLVRMGGSEEIAKLMTSSIKEAKRISCG